MTAFQSLFVGVTGLQAQSNALGVISDNIANVNTVGYKKVGAVFQDMVASDKAATFSPGGAKSTARQFNRTQGSIFLTSSFTDLAIAGNGFIAVRQGSATSESILYTRAGSFLPNQDGDFINGAGFFLQGWLLNDEELPAGLDIDSVPGSTGLTSLETVNVGTLNESFAPTTAVSVIANLKSSQIIYAGTPAYNAASPAANMADGAVPPAFIGAVTIVDSTGEEHTLRVGFLKTAINTWAVEIYPPTAAEIGAASAQLAAGTLTFNGDGTLNSVSASLTSPVSITWVDPAGATNSMTFEWGTAGPLGDGLADGVIQVEKNFSLSSSQDGFPTGSLSSIVFTDEGFVVANFNNGVSQKLYKIPLATFTEPNELQSVSGTAFTITELAGELFFSGANQGAAGKFIAGGLEGSNADIGDQMVEMIIAQRAYQANSKSISINSDMLDRLNRMLGV